jgi:hypothetical protein
LFGTNPIRFSSSKSCERTEQIDCIAARLTKLSEAHCLAECHPSLPLMQWNESYAQTVAMRSEESQKLCRICLASSRIPRGE